MTDEPSDAQALEDLAAACVKAGYERIDTHISTVLLHGDDVYKTKRPVNLGFLDFSTLEKRRLACEAEVELNRRLAPSVYHGVVPVTRAGGEYSFGSSAEPKEGGPVEGEPVEWAVHMRRLDETNRADALLARGELTQEHVSAVARLLADFHEHCPTDAHIATFGSNAVIQGNVQENFDQVRELIERYIGPEVFSEIEHWQNDFLRSRRASFSQRLQEGRVRDGHGDLRLDHVYFEGGKAEGDISILDCIEFNERFRYADVCADSAFLAMDLAASGSVALAEMFLASYARYANDYGIYPLVDFYQSYRAFVRAKVFALTESLAPHSAIESEALRKLARKHFLLAQASDRRPAVPARAIAVGGWIASGKSTIAAHIAEELQCPLIDADWTRKWLLHRTPFEQIGESAFSGGYSKTATASVYRELLERADAVLDSGRSVVVDASFRSRTHRSLIRRLAVERGLEFLFVECQAPRSVCRERLEERQRRKSLSEGRLEIFDDFVASWEDVREIPPAQHLVLDTSRSLEESVSELRRVLGPWLAPPASAG